MILKEHDAVWIFPLFKLSYTKIVVSRVLTKAQTRILFSQFFPQVRIVNVKH